MPFSMSNNDSLRALTCDRLPHQLKLLTAVPGFMKIFLSRCIILGGLFIGSATVPNSPAGESVLDFSHLFGGVAPASTEHTWVEALFKDISPGVVGLTISNLNLSGSEDVDSVYLNLSPALNPNSLSFSFQNAAGKLKNPDITQGTDAFKAGGDGKYDILFSFATSMGDNQRFNAGESITYFISGIPGLKATDFEYLSAPDGGAGPFYAAAHVQRIGTASLSGWIASDTIAPVTVPEPRSFCLVALLIALALGINLAKRAAVNVEARLKPGLIKLPKNSGGSGACSARPSRQN